MRVAQETPAKIRVFIASPGDVEPERDTLERVIGQLNHTLEKVNAPLRMEPFRFEKNAVPGPGRPQKVIDRQAGEYDVFIGIMWRRFGTPMPKAKSGTEHEYRRAYRRWKSRGRPYMMFYFSRAAAPPPSDLEEAEQLVLVTKFRVLISREQQFAAFYDGPRDFEVVIRRHLDEVLEIFLKKLARQRRRREQVLAQGDRGMFEAVSMVSRPSRRGNGALKDQKPLGRTVKKAVKEFIRETKKEDGPWRNPPRTPRPKPSSPRRRSPPRRSR